MFLSHWQSVANQQEKKKESRQQPTAKPSQRKNSSSHHNVRTFGLCIHSVQKRTPPMNMTKRQSRAALKDGKDRDEKKNLIIAVIMSIFVAIAKNRIPFSHCSFFYVFIVCNNIHFIYRNGMAFYCAIFIGFAKELKLCL